jgi:xylulokinase
MMGCLLVDREGEALRNMITWADTRAGAEEKDMIRRLGMDYVYRITGHRISASYSAAKLLWIRNNESGVYKRAFKMLQAKDYVIHKLTGSFVTDYSDASGTNLFDIEKKTWDPRILGALDIPPGLLPDPHPSTARAGGLSAEAAGRTGLLEGTPVIIGGGDGSCACVGAGVVSEGNAYNVLGSSSWISLASAVPVREEEMRTFTWVHLDPSLYTPCGTMQAAGYSYNWYKNTLCTGEIAKAAETGEDPYRLMDREALASAPGAGGSICLPYFLGERSPRWNHDARGAFVGLSITTGKGDISRAVLEGVGLNLKIILRLLEKASESEIEKVRVIGGGAKGAAWLGILADIWQKPLEVPAYTEEATSLGAAVCGGVGLGAFRDFSVIHKFNPPVSLVTPNAERGPLYEELLDIFNRAYDSLEDVFRRLASFRAKNAGK